MTRRSAHHFPAAALQWLIPGDTRDVLTLGIPAANMAYGLVAAGHRLTVIDRTPSTLENLPGVLSGAQKVVAQAESLPFTAHHFDAVVVSQTFHNLTIELALPEIARVLRPNGALAISYVVRDDSVPWVRRLAAIIQQADPSAMRGDYGTESVDKITFHRGFPFLDRQDFRMWIPVTRTNLIEMVRSRPALAHADPQLVTELSQQVGSLYDSSARAPEPLLLPWRVQCWRAVVDHSELSIPLLTADDAMNIRL